METSWFATGRKLIVRYIVFKKINVKRLMKNMSEDFYLFFNLLDRTKGIPTFFVQKCLFFFLLLGIQGHAQTSLKLGLNWKPEPQFGGFYEAFLKGYFKKEGFNIEILPGGSGTPTVQMLANGVLDIAIVSAEEIVISQARNPQNKIIALFAVYQKNPQIIMTRDDRKIKSLKDLFQSEGVMSLQSGLTYAQFLIKKFAPLKAKIVPYGGGIQSFISEKNFSQQGFATSEPLLAEKANVKPKVFIIADEGFNPYTTVVAIKETNLKKIKNIKALIEAIRNGWDSYLKDPNATNQFMNGLNPSMDLSLMRESAELQKPFILPPKPQRLGEMSISRWKELIQQLIEFKVIKESLNPKDLFQNL